MSGLTVGAIAAIERGESPSDPVVQLLEIKKSVQPDGSSRVKVYFSDGQQKKLGILTGGVSRLVEEGSVQNLTVVKLTDYTAMVSPQNNNIVLIAHDAQVVAPMNFAVGNPEDVRKVGTTAKPQPITPLKSKRIYGAQSPSSAVVRGNTTATITPIRGLNPYSSRWMIQCRVLSKSAVRTWDKGPSNQGKLFNINLLDNEENEIRATFFKDAVDKFEDMLVVGSVYNFSNGQIKLANKKFNNTNCDYEIIFGASAEIIPVDAEATKIKKISIKPVKVKDINPTLTGLVDVCGVVLTWGTIETFTSKAGREITKLDITVADESNESIKCTIFGEKCYEFERAVEKVNAAFKTENLTANIDNLIICALKGAKVSDFNGCSISLLPSSEIYVNPEIEQKNLLLRWVQSGVNLSSISSKSNEGNRPGNAGSLSDRKTLQHIDSLEEFDNEKGDYFTTKATVGFIRKNTISYAACPEEGVNKKVILQNDGSYFCEGTGKSYNECQHRYIISAELADHTGSLWVTLFNNEAEKIIGYSADELEQIRQSNEEMFDAILLNATFEEFVFRLRVKNEIYNEEGRKRVTVAQVDKINYVTETKQLEEYVAQFD